MAESYEVTVKVRVTAHSRRHFGDNETARAEWVRDGAEILADGIDQEVGKWYRERGADFEVVSSTAIPTTVVGV